VLMEVFCGRQNRVMLNKNGQQETLLYPTSYIQKWKDW
jgi:hypothetical protein